MTRYIFDVTALRSYLARHAQLSGIQRVSVMTIDRARKKLGANEILFGYHDRRKDTYTVCSCPPDPTVDLTDSAILCELFRIKRSLRALPGMENVSRKPVNRYLQVYLRDFHAAIGNTKHFNRKGLSLAEWRKARGGFRTSRSPVNSLGPLEDVTRPGDRLVLLDNAWLPKGLEPWLKQAGTTLGLEVCVLLHDLIPLVTPQYTEGDICIRFHDWLTRSPDYVTCYLANSENTGRDLRDFLKSQNATQPVKVVPLAQATLHDTHEGGIAESAHPVFKEAASIPAPIRALTKTPYVLVVGTLEVRKNLWQLATVWDRLRRQSGRTLPKLVFAGRRGWLNEDFEALMQATGRLGGWVELVEGPSDDSLAYLYRNCLFTVTVSFYEGWGLPIGESLAYGKTAVVSNSSAMPEVGGDMVEYCDPHSLDSIKDACLRLIDNPAYRKELEERIAHAHLRSWEDVARDMLEAICAPGTVVSDDVAREQAEYNQAQP